jgi:hypothetical protein
MRLARPGALSMKCFDTKVAEAPGSDARRIMWSSAVTLGPGGRAVVVAMLPGTVCRKILNSHA